MSDQPYSARVLELADKWIGGSITESEKQEFIDWYNRFDDHELLLPPEFEPIIRQLESDMLATLKKRIAGDASPPTRLFRMKPWKAAAAAILVATAGLGVLLVSRRTSNPASAATAKQRSPTQHDIQPGGNKALLTLADGSTIVLDSAHSGALAKQGNTRVEKLNDGELKYSSATAGSVTTEGTTAAMSYNILSTPKGGQYRLVLPDGTKVWLNAASAIRYPTSFTGTSREVEIAGEAYFEIAPNPALPFRVLAAGHLGDADPQHIDVLGTHFNINAYSDETIARTTLVEGAVRVSKDKIARLLKPGQQSALQKDGSLRLVPDADVEEAVAWKDGVFEFNDEELPVIMRQIARWYDVEIVYEGQVPTDRFTGRVSRNTTLSGLLRILQYSDVHLTISNNRIIVR